MGKIRQGEFVGFKELLSDNISLLKKLQEVGQFYLTPLSALSTASKLQSVKYPLSWAFCFLFFLAAKTESQEAWELAAYGQLVIQLARKHGGKGWLAYDTLFRQQWAAGSALPWTEINTSLMAATVLGTGDEATGGKVGALCSGSDHIQTECALNVLASEHLFSPPGSSSLLRCPTVALHLTPERLWETIAADATTEGLAQPPPAASTTTVPFAIHQITRLFTAPDWNRAEGQDLPKVARETPLSHRKVTTSICSLRD